MQITLSFDLTEENLEKLKVFCTDTKAIVRTNKKTTKPIKETPTAEITEPEKNLKSEHKEIPEPKSEAAVSEASKEKINMTDVRAVALKISKAGKSDILREIFGKFGATNLKGIAESDYEALMRELVAVDV
ncbi:MAG: hypothetical protein Q4D26_07550 [Clostridia bacterium]|nr:hypothetical protein [Clostridia bacterium]